MKEYKNYIIGVSILVLGIILGNVFSGGNSNSQNKEEHNYVQDKKTGIWTCSMHPQIKMDKPGNCPICGMELIPLEESGSGEENIASNEIVMTAEAIQLANIQTSLVSRVDATKEIRLLGRVKPDERRLYSQVSHLPGRIERLYINFTGEKVSKGQRIVRIYSPDLISAQKELFESIRSKDIYPQLYTASRNKLKLWKLSDNQINAIEKSGKVQEQLDIYSDYSGYVMKRNVELGDYVKAGSNLFEIANLNYVWVMFEAYESDIPWIHIGDKVNFTVQAIPGINFKGKITYVDPFVSSNTRVAKVRVELKNFNNKLLPEMYATGILKAKLKKAKNAIVVPKSAVLWTGKRAVVYVKVPHEKTISFVYREITLGENLGNFYIVKKGLKEGEVVATNGVFRIDASAQLVGKKSMMNPEGGKVSLGGHAGMDMGNSNDNEMKNKKKGKEEDTNHADMNKRINSSASFKKQLENVFNQYIDLKNAFIKDNNKMASSSAQSLLGAIKKVDMKELSNPKAHNHWMTISKEIIESANTIVKSLDIKKQRYHFKHLSAHLSKAVKLFGVNQKVFEQFCPMADDNKGAYWLSLNEQIKNPYFGSKMLKCGSNKTIIIE